MKTAENLPVEYDRISKTWKSSSTILDLDPISVTSEDRRALLFSLAAAGQLEGTPVCRQIHRLYRALLDNLPPEKVTQFEKMMSSVRFTGPTISAIRPDVWANILLCLEARESMAIVYVSGIDGKSRPRQVDPYGLLMRDRHWILIAYCHRCGEVITFAVHRITKASSTDRSFQMPAKFMDQCMAGAFDGWVATGKTTKITLRIAKDAPLYVLDRIWSGNETRSHDRQGNTLVNFQTTALFAVEREVRANAGLVEVLRPHALRQRLRDDGSAIARAHQ